MPRVANYNKALVQQLREQNGLGQAKKIDIFVTFLSEIGDIELVPGKATPLDVAAAFDLMAQAIRSAVQREWLENQKAVRWTEMRWEDGEFSAR